MRFSESLNDLTANTYRGEQQARWHTHENELQLLQNRLAALVLSTLQQVKIFYLHDSGVIEFQRSTDSVSITLQWLCA